MEGNNSIKKYESFKIPDRITDHDGKGVLPSLKLDAGSVNSASDELFHELEYDSAPISGADTCVIKGQKMLIPETDPIRELFYRMRDIAKDCPLTFISSRFLEKRTQNDRVAIFYRQGLFMEDFEDDYPHSAVFFQYYPSYQMMGYEQLRTYFTWRTRVRRGNMDPISFSYVFIYIYELLGNIGVKDPQDGLEKLLFIRENYKKVQDPIDIDKYLLPLIKDYYVYYNLPGPWGEFVRKYDFGEYYPNGWNGDEFELFCNLSQYDIRKSKFYGEDTKDMIMECFLFVLDRIRRDFQAGGINFDDAFFRPRRGLRQWKPFGNATFYNHLKQPDRHVILSKDEIYICKRDKWKWGANLASEKGMMFMGYVMKRMDMVLRREKGHKYMLKAYLRMIHKDTLQILIKKNLLPEEIVDGAVLDYLKNSSKIIVTVDHRALDKIRKEARATQEALIVEVPEDEQPVPPTLFMSQSKGVISDSPEIEAMSHESVWDDFRDALEDMELNALGIVLEGNDLRAHADEHGVMLEVLADLINEKAMDFIGDNLLDGDFLLYDEYKNQVKELLQ